MVIYFVVKFSAKALLKAAEEGDVESLNEIVSESASVEYTARNTVATVDTLSWMSKTDKKGRTALHLAALYGHIYVVRNIWSKIIGSTKDMDLRKQYINITDHKGRTPLFHAAAAGHNGVAQYLIDKKADLNICTNEIHGEPGSTALMKCAEKNGVDCFKLLLEKGANVQTMRKDGADALYLAARYGNHEIIKLMAATGKLQLIINRPSFHGRTALLTAALHGHFQSCKELYAHGADLDHQDDDQFTSLIYATNEGHLLLTKWLVQKGANVYIKDKYGGSAFDVALANDYTEIMNFLKEWQDRLKNGRRGNELMKAAVECSRIEHLIELK